MPKSSSTFTQTTGGKPTGTRIVTGGATVVRIGKPRNEKIKNR